MVLLGHSESTLPHGYTGWLRPLWWIADASYGVQIFFVLSGYLITSILLKEYDTIGKLDIKAFYCRRILRIFPAFYFFLLTIIALDWMGVFDITRTELAIAFAHLLNYEQAITLVFHLPKPDTFDHHYVGHLWSLSMEEQFYWMWPITLLVLLRKRWYGILLGVILAMPVIRFTSYYLFPDLRGQLTMMLHSGSDAIFSGCLLAICMVRHPELSKKLLLPSWGVAGLLLYFFVLDTEITPHMPRGYGVTVGMTLITVCITLFVANILRPEGTLWYQRFLELRPVVFLGRISYSVYLWQQLFTTNTNTTFTGIFPLNIVISMALGWVSYQLIEVPFIRLKDKYFPPHIKAAPAGIVPLAPANA